MTALSALRAEATTTAQERGHLVRWFRAYSSAYRCLQIGTCDRCGQWVQLDTRPPANGIEVGGPALAVGCGDEA